MHRISHRHIDIFRALMTAGSVTQAAALLHSSQPTVSRELARLEHILGYALFDRGQGRLRATARALDLFAEVERSYQGLARVQTRAAELARAEQEQLSLLCLPALSHALLPSACAAFMRGHPLAQLSITPQESPLLEEWMSAQRFDLGLSEQDLTPPGTQRELLLSMDEVCVLPAQHPLLKKKRLHPKDFEGQAFVSLSEQDPYRRLLDDMFACANVVRHTRVETHSAVAVCAMVQAGLGLAIVNPLTAMACAGPGLHLRPLSVSIPFQVSVLRPSFRASNALVEPFLKQLKSCVKDLQAAMG